jgi:Cys-tRNA(Pro) deacylase
MRKQRWGRPEALVAARRYNALAREHGLTPTQMALAFCYTSWRVASTIIGVTSVAQLDEDLDAWGTTAVARAAGRHRRIRWELRDPPFDTVMARKDHVSETPATALLRQHKVAFTEHPYEYLEHGGAQHSAQVLGWTRSRVVKTLVMQDQDAKPLLVLMHGNRKVSTKNLARQIGAKSVSPASPRWPTATAGIWWAAPRRLARGGPCRCTSSKSILALPRIAINGGRRGYLVGLDPQVCVQLLGAKPVQCALAE